MQMENRLTRKEYLAGMKTAIDRDIRIVKELMGQLDINDPNAVFLIKETIFFLEAIKENTECLNEENVLQKLKEVQIEYCLVDGIPAFAFSSYSKSKLRMNGMVL